MNDGSFDAVIRQAAGGVSRRTSLKALGAAGLLAMFARPNDGVAKSTRKQRKAKTVDRCSPQQEQCTRSLSPICEGEGCLLVQRCCVFAGKCQINGFFDCLLGAA